MLRQLFDEFGDLETVVGATVDVPELAGRLHKLGGSAGMIGAVALSERARDACRALRQNRDDGLWALAQEVVPELARLRASTAPLLAATAVSSSPPAGGAFADPDDIQYAARFEQLRGLLEERRLDALDVFARLTPGLKDRLGNDDFCALQSAVDALQYEHALRILGATSLASTRGGGGPRAPM